MQKADWNVLPGLLEGLHTAGRVVPEPSIEKAIRLAARAGRLDVIVECARRVARTGFALNSRSRVAILMWWVQFQALDAGFEGKKTAHQLKVAEQIAVLLEDEKHAGGKLHSVDPRTSPEITGVLLELAAVNAKVNGGQDTDGAVEKYAKRFVATMQKRELEGFLTTFRPNNSLLTTVAPIRYGVKTALEVLSKEKNAELVAQLQQIKEEMDEQVAQLVAATEEEMAKAKNPALGLQVHEKIEALA